MLMIQANKIDTCKLEINLFEREKVPRGDQIDFIKYYKPVKESTQEIYDKNNSQIYQIDVRTYDEESYFNSSRMSKCSKDAFLNVNYENKYLKCFHLEMENTKKFKTNFLHEINFDTQKIESISGSNLIRGECAVLTNDGNVYLTNELSSNLNDLTKIARNLQAKFKSDLDFKSIKIGSQPRSFIYSDHSQITFIDSRIKTSLNLISKEILNPINKYLEPNEIICRTDIVENDYNYHLACCSKTLILLDERFPNRPLLSWKHFLDLPAQYLCNTFVSPDRNVIICSDLDDIFMYQFSTNTNNIPISFEFDRKLDRPVEIIHQLPESYDKRLDRYLQNRLGKSILSLSLLRFYDSFALFQVLK